MSDGILVCCLFYFFFVVILCFKMVVDLNFFFVQNSISMFCFSLHKKR